MTRYHLDCSLSFQEIATPVCGLVRNDRKIRLPLNRAISGAPEAAYLSAAYAPRPCSSSRLRVPSHLPGLSDRAPKNTLLFTAFSYTQNIIAQKQSLCQHLSGNKWAFIVLSKDRCHCEEPQRGDVAIPSKGPRRTIKRYIPETCRGLPRRFAPRNDNFFFICKKSLPIVFREGFCYTILVHSVASRPGTAQTS